MESSLPRRSRFQRQHNGMFTERLPLGSSMSQSPADYIGWRYPLPLLFRPSPYLRNGIILNVEHSCYSYPRWQSRGQSEPRPLNYSRGNSISHTSGTVTPYTRLPSCSIGSSSCFLKLEKLTTTLREHFSKPSLQASADDFGPKGGARLDQSPTRME